MIIRLGFLATTRAHCVESLSKTLKAHGQSSPPRWKKKWVPARYHAGKVKQTSLCRSSSVPPQQNIVESGLKATEMEMVTTAKSLELRFRLYSTYVKDKKHHYIVYCYFFTVTRITNSHEEAINGIIRLRNSKFTLLSHYKHYI